MSHYKFLIGLFVLFQSLGAFADYDYCFQRYGLNFGDEYSYITGPTVEGPKAIDFQTLHKLSTEFRQNYSGMGLCFYANKTSADEQQAYDDLAGIIKGRPAYLHIDGERFSLQTSGITAVYEIGEACDLEYERSLHNALIRLDRFENGKLSVDEYFYKSNTYEHTYYFTVREEEEKRGLALRLQQNPAFPAYMNCYFPH